MSIIYSNSSVTHTFGNVACLAMSYIKKFFGEDYFNVEHISTKLAYRQLNIFKTQNEFWKLHKPMLIIRPRIEMDDSSKYFYGSAYMNKTHNVTSPMEFANTVSLLKDPEMGTSIEFLWNRYKIYYDVVIIVDSYNEQLNLIHHMMNSMVPNAPFMIHSPLEAYIPRCVINGLADHIGLDKENEIGDIVRYLNTYGNTPFTYKFKNGSGNNEYFALYDTNVEAIISEISFDDGVEKGFITEAFTISFTMSCEFNSMGAFYLMLRDNSDKFIPFMPDNVSSDNRVIPLYSIPLLFNLGLDPGWRIHSAPPYFVNHGVEKDETNIQALMDTFIKNVLTYQRHMKLPQDLFVKFRAFKGDVELPNDETGFTVDLSDLDNPILTTYDINHKETYRLFIVVNNDYINSITTELNGFNEEK